VFLMKSDGSAQTNLTNSGPPIAEFGPTFSADGQRIGFERYDPSQGLDNIAAIRPDGSSLTNLTSTAIPGVDYAPGWESIQRCGKRRATIVGDDGPDRIKGTKKRDVIVANAGKDKVNGRGGNDLICLGKGKDKASGGKGTDKCVGGPAKDKGKSCEKGKL
jgi:Ca2+-binding RTX toxin-like protein